MFWLGQKLGPVHAACVRSFLRHGHEVVLHCYDAPLDMPAGVTTFDANRLMPEGEIIRHRASGSLALGSNRYRYRLLREGFGLYVDCDVFCVRPFDFDGYVFGYEYNHKFNSAVLDLPPESELASRLLQSASDDFFIPPWLSDKKRRKDRIKRYIGMGKHVSTRPWGVIGPDLLTWHVKDLGLEKEAKPIDFFYPLHHDHIRQLWSKELRLADFTTKNTYAIHLYNSFIERFGWPVEAGTPLHEIVAS